LNHARITEARRIPAARTKRRQQLDFSRLRQGEIVAGIGGIALFFFLFLDWFEGSNGWRSLASEVVGGGVTGFVVALTSIAAIKFAALAAWGKRLNVPLPRGVITLALGVLSTLIILWTVLVAPEEAEIKFGLFLGLAAAVAISAGALLALREGGWEPLVGDGSAARPARTTTTRSVASSSSSSTSRKPAAKKRAAKKRAAKRSARS
jgi:hypothetical protein